MISQHHPRRHARGPGLHADDNIAAKLTRGGQTVQNHYDALHSLTLPSPATAIQTTTTYDLAGRTLTVSDSAGQGLAYGFDSAKRPPSPRLLRVYVTSATENGITVLTAYTHDALSRRTNLAYGNGTTQAFTYSTGGDWGER